MAYIRIEKDYQGKSKILLDAVDITDKVKELQITDESNRTEANLSLLLDGYDAGRAVEYDKERDERLEIEYLIDMVVNCMFEKYDVKEKKKEISFFKERKPLIIIPIILAVVGIILSLWILLN